MTRHLRHVLKRGLFSTLLSLLVFPPCASFSQAAQTTDPSSFSEAVAAFKSGKLEEARKLFLELEKQFPGNPTIMLNLGLIAQKEKRPGAALGLWRKALIEQPTDEALRNAVDWTKSKLTKSEIAHDAEPWEDLRRTVLTRVAPIAMNISAAVFLLIAGWRLVRWWAARRRALELETEMPTPPLSGFVFLAMALVFLAISISIYVDRLDIRGTVMPVKVEVRSAPDTTATVLFDLFEGMEVIVRDSRMVGETQWRRITYPGGMTGWVRDRDLMASTDPSTHAWEPSN